ncbi:putative xlf family protein [Botrytis fragariae]|uniref:Non-homologous end-joining factor 1 n=1 Tax=Botrytis fragariae TaxID=1964551 RepID=A0A8H6APW3_9HELO|nr:putative xlf family protein [Botrytis fragariae]KAF5871616.1 putative xlf family protein [Botrytis fragariae]
MAAWRPLKLSSSAGAQLPPFLISSEFNDDSYLVQLSDLTNTWVESVDRDAIIERSREGNTSIDPSEDEDQLSIFLEKIRLGLAGGIDTSLSLQVGPEIGDDLSPSLLLHVTIPLPGGLKDLEWRYELALQTPKETVDKLLIPSLIALQEKKKEVEKLVELLEEKDAVIQKLVDTLENQGNDLGIIFHQVAGRPGKKIDRKKASEKIQGLKIFDVEAWKQKSESDKPDDKWELLHNVFGGNDISPNLSKADRFDKEDRNYNWWKNMQGKRVGTSGSKPAINATGLSRRRIQQEHTQSEDDFQVQSTPPHLSRPKAKPDVSMDDSTEEDDDDDDLDAPSQRSSVPDNLSISQARAPSPDRTLSPSPSPPRVKPLVKLGTKRKVPTPTPPSENADDATEDDEPIPAILHSTNAIDDNYNDNDTTDDDAPSSSPPKRHQTPKTSPAEKGKLGKIGGKKAPSPSPEPESEPDPEPIAEPEATKVRPKRGILGKIGGKKKGTVTIPEIDSQNSVSPKKKLGTIGGKKAATGGASQREDTPDEVSRGRERALTIETEKSKEKTPPPRETSEERADKKRAILKKELEAKVRRQLKRKGSFEGRTRG